MISLVDFSSDPNDCSERITSVIRGNRAVYPVFDGNSFIYVLRHTLTGFIFCEAGTRDVALKALDDLYALHPWDDDEIKPGWLPQDVVHKGLDLTG